MGEIPRKQLSQSLVQNEYLGSGGYAWIVRSLELLIVLAVILPALPLIHASVKLQIISFSSVWEKRFCFHLTAYSVFKVHFPRKVVFCYPRLQSRIKPKEIIIVSHVLLLVMLWKVLFNNH